jgi:hypothetical protein
MEKPELKQLITALHKENNKSSQFVTESIPPACLTNLE